MFKFILTAALLLPLAYANVSPKSQNIIPVPDCFPCDDDKGGWPWLTGKRASAEITNLAPADLRRRSLLAVVKS